MRKTLAGLILVLTLVVSLIGTQLGTQNAQAAGWLDGWANRVKITIDHTKINSSLSNFPILVNLSTSSGINRANLSSVFNEIGTDANRKKIAVTTSDGTTQCFVEIEKWDTAGRNAVLWVRVPSVASNSGTELYLYYDRTRPDNNSWVGDPQSTPAKNVWDPDFKAVLHLGENPGTASGGYRDSTANNHHATAGSSSAVPTRTIGKIGDSQSFNGSHYIQIPDYNDFSVSTTGQLTISFWLSPNVQNMTSSSSGYIHLLGKGQSNQHEWAFRIYNANYQDRPQAISVYHWNLNGGLGAGSRWDHSNIPNGDWVHITGRFGRVDGCSDISLFANGVRVDTDPYSGYSIIPRNGTAPLRIGTRDLASYLNGRIDEFRVSSVARSDAWIRAGYHSENDNLLTFGTPESSPNPNPNPTPSPDPTPAPTPDGDTFGLDNGNNTYDQHANAIQAMRFQNTADDDGRLTQLELLVTDTNPTGKVRLGVYTDINGSPGSLLVDAGEVDIRSGWVSSQTPLNLPVTRNTHYWLAYTLQNTNQVAYQSARPTGSHFWADNQAFSTLPGNYPSTGTGSNSNQYVMRATVTNNVTSPSPAPTPDGGTFGLDNGNNTYDQHANAIQAMRFQNTAGDGRLTQLELLVTDTNPTGKVRLGIYADNNGRPGRLLVDGGEVDVVNGWVSTNVRLNLPVSQNSYYWLAYSLQNTNQVRYQSARPAGSHFWADNQAFSTLPGNYPSSGTGSNSNQYVMRATLIPQ